MLQNYTALSKNSSTLNAHRFWVNIFGLWCRGPNEKGTNINLYLLINFLRQLIVIKKFLDIVLKHTGNVNWKYSNMAQFDNWQRTYSKIHRQNLKKINQKNFIKLVWPSEILKLFQTSFRNFRFEQFYDSAGLCLNIHNPHIREYGLRKFAIL